MSTTQPGVKSDSAKARDSNLELLVGRHLRFGWSALLVFLSLGILLEGLHGFKVGWYLNESNSTRRLMFTLAHAHGTLLGLVNLAFAASLPHLTGRTARDLSLASNCLIGAGVLLPAGFFLGGISIYAGDPGLGIVLVPVGALLLFTAVWLIVRAAGGPKATRKPPASPSARK